MISKRDDFIRAILDDPDDDVVRLAFADFLEENGETDYSQFIRIQMELAKVPCYDPLWIRCWFQNKDAITGRKWNHFLPVLPPGIRWVNAFERGFPASIEVSQIEKFLEHAPALVTLAPIQSLRITTTSPVNIAALAGNAFLGRLRRLSFSGSHLRTADVKRLQGSLHAGLLKNLDFENALDSHGAAALFQPPLMTQLTHLRLHGNSLSAPKFTKAILDARGPHTLRSLVLSESCYQLSSGIFQASLLRELAEIDLTGCALGQKGLESFAEGQNSGRLESLNLARTNPGAAGIRALAAQPKLAGLRRLVLCRNGLGPVACRHLSHSPHLANLHILDLSNNRLGDFENNKIGDNGAITLAESPHLTNLLQLELMNCEIGDAGAMALLNSPVTAKLVHLNLSGGGPEQFAKSVRKKLIERFGEAVLC